MAWSLLLLIQIDYLLNIIKWGRMEVVNWLLHLDILNKRKKKAVVAVKEKLKYSLNSNVYTFQMKHMN